MSRALWGFFLVFFAKIDALGRTNTVNTSYGYDTLSRLLSVTHAKGGVTLDGATYTVDNAGNRTAKSDLYAGVTTNYGYDNIYELLSAAQGGTTTESYTYDPVGNRLTALGSATWSYNTSNELNSRPGASYAYDANGNTTTKTDSTGTTNYTWDFENRMTSAILPGNGGTVSFKYDPFGRRIYKSSSSGTSVFAYDGDNLIEETNSAGTAVARYSQGLNIDEPLAMLRGGATNFYHADGLGSITSLSNGSGSLAQTYGYDSFGKQLSSTGSLTNPFQYTAREFDPETSLYYYRARYYDPSASRFLSEDPITFDGGVNFYGYTQNMPTLMVDPGGLEPNNWSPIVVFLHLFGPPALLPVRQPLFCTTASECKFTPDMNDALQCFQNCMDKQIKITGGRGARSKANSSHSRGEACDLGRNSNPGFSPDNVKPCFASCFPHGYGQEEKNGPQTPGTHFHFQLNPVPGGKPGFARGVQPYTP